MDPENTPEGQPQGDQDQNQNQSTDQNTDQPSQDAKLAEYYKTEFEKMKAEVRELVGQRDLHKNEALSLKQKYSRSKPTESDEYKELFNQNKELKEQMDLIRNGQENEKRKALFVEKARERGMTDDALKAIDSFNIDLSSIDPSQDVSAEIVVESVRKNLGFLFQEKKSAPKPPDRLLEGEKTGQEAYEKYLREGNFQKAKEFLEKK